MTLGHLRKWKRSSLPCPQAKQGKISQLGKAEVVHKALQIVFKNVADTTRGSLLKDLIRPLT